MTDEIINIPDNENYNEEDNKDDKLIKTCIKKLSFMKRDKVYLSRHGISAPFMMQFESKIRTFNAIPSSNDLKNIINTTENNKFSTRLEILVILRGIETKARYAFGEYSSVYKNIKRAYNQLNDVQLLLHSRTVRIASEQNFSALASFGLVSSTSKTLSIKNEDFYVALTNMKRALNFETTTMKKREELSNELFETLVKYCDIGKTSMLLHQKELSDDYTLEL